MCLAVGDRGHFRVAARHPPNAVSRNLGFTVATKLQASICSALARHTYCVGVVSHSLFTKGPDPEDARQPDRHDQQRGQGA